MPRSEVRILLGSLFTAKYYTWLFLFLYLRSMNNEMKKIAIKKRVGGFKRLGIIIVDAILVLLISLALIKTVFPISEMPKLELSEIKDQYIVEGKEPTEITTSFDANTGDSIEVVKQLPIPEDKTLISKLELEKKLESAEILYHMKVKARSAKAVLVIAVIFLLYFFYEYLYNASLGKLLFKVRIKGPHGEELTQKQRLTRYLIKASPFIIMALASLAYMNGLVSVDIEGNSYGPISFLDTIAGLIFVLQIIGILPVFFLNYTLIDGTSKTSVFPKDMDLSTLGEEVIIEKKKTIDSVDKDLLNLLEDDDEESEKKTEE